MNIRILTYSAAVALIGLTGCVVAPGHGGGYDQGRRDERRTEEAREHREATREREERRDERDEHYCADPYNRAHDDRCK